MSKHHLNILLQMLKSKQGDLCSQCLSCFFLEHAMHFVIVSSVKTHIMDTMWKDEVPQLPKEPAPSSHHQLKLVEMNPTLSHSCFLGSSKIPVISCSCRASATAPCTVRHDPARLGSTDHPHSFPAARKYVITWACRSVYYTHCKLFWPNANTFI